MARSPRNAKLRAVDDVSHSGPLLHASPEWNESIRISWFSAPGQCLQSSCPTLHQTIKTYAASPPWFASGEVPVPILSVVSSGTRHPFRNRLSRLNHAIISTILREIVSPYLSRSSLNVSSRKVALFDNSSVALQTKT